MGGEIILVQYNCHLDSFPDKYWAEAWEQDSIERIYTCVLEKDKINVCTMNNIWKGQFENPNNSSKKTITILLAIGLYNVIQIKKAYKV